MTTVPADIAIGAPPAPPPARPRTLLIGTSFAAVASVLAFAGLAALYIEQRAAVIHTGAPWIPTDADIPTTPGTVMLATLVMSVITMQWAVWAVARDDRPRAFMALGITVLLGLAYIN